MLFGFMLTPFAVVWLGDRLLPAALDVQKDAVPLLPLFLSPLAFPFARGFTVTPPTGPGAPHRLAERSHIHWEGLVRSTSLSVHPFLHSSVSTCFNFGASFIVEFFPPESVRNLPENQTFQQLRWEVSPETAFLSSESHPRESPTRPR